MRQPRQDKAGSSNPSNANRDSLNEVVVVLIDVNVDDNLIVLYDIVDSSPSA